MNFSSLVVLVISIGLASAQLGQLLGFNQQQCPPCVCNNVVSQSQSQAQSQAQNQGGGGGGGGPPPGPPPGRGPGGYPGSGCYRCGYG